MQQYGYGGSPFTAGASNPEMVRRHIAQDLGYYGQAQMMQPQMGAQSSMQGQSGFGTGTFSQFGSNPQMVRQHIAQDLGYQGQPMQMNMGAMNAMHPMSTTNMMHTQAQGYQPIQNQSYYNPGVFQQVMSATPNEAQWVRQQIQQDIQAGAQPPAYLSHQQTQNFQPYSGGSTLSQFGTNPQTVQSHIQNDLNYSGQYMSSMPTSSQGYGTSMMAQYGTNPQVVQSHIQSDLNRSGQYQPINTFNQGTGTSMMSQYGSNPQMVRQHIQNDLGGMQSQTGYY